MLFLYVPGIGSLPPPGVAVAMSFAPILLHPVPNVAAVAALIVAASQLSFFLAVVLICVVAIVYVIVGPRVKRSRSLWGAACPPRKASDVTLSSNKTTWGSPALVLHHAVKPTDDVLDTIGLNSAPLDNAVFCVPHTRMFLLPLFRVFMWLVGGIVPYSRTVVINLLKRNRCVVVVSYPSAVKPAGSNLSLELQHKGVFAAALKTGASIIPCVTFENGGMHLGEPVKVANTETVPTPDSVTDLSKRYAAAVAALYTKHNPTASRKLNVKA